MRLHPCLLILLGFFSSIAILLAGCRTSTDTGQTESHLVQRFSKQLSALSNDVQRLTSRIGTLESEREELKSSAEFMQKVLDEMRYEPVVGTSLIGVDDSGATLEPEIVPPDLQEMWGINRAARYRER
jgi:hypothetical protein